MWSVHLRVRARAEHENGTSHGMKDQMAAQLNIRYIFISIFHHIFFDNVYRELCIFMNAVHALDYMCFIVMSLLCV